MTTASKGGRPATGGIKWRTPKGGGDSCWHARITMADGSRPYIRPARGIAGDDEKDGEGVVIKLPSERAMARNLRSPPGPTC